MPELRFPCSGLRMVPAYGWFRPTDGSGLRAYSGLRVRTWREE